MMSMIDSMANVHKLKLYTQKVKSGERSKGERCSRKQFICEEKDVDLYECVAY